MEHGLDVDAHVVAVADPAAVAQVGLAAGGLHVHMADVVRELVFVEPHEVAETSATPVGDLSPALNALMLDGHLVVGEALDVGEHMLA